MWCTFRIIFGISWFRNDTEKRHGNSFQNKVSRVKIPFPVNQLRCELCCHLILNALFCELKNKPFIQLRNDFHISLTRKKLETLLTLKRQFYEISHPRNVFSMKCPSNNLLSMKYPMHWMFWNLKGRTYYLNFLFLGRLFFYIPSQVPRMHI